ncbi:MAG: hydroxymethylbilane synthase, partial [Kocuria sp.]|nr:hydroxymethylbilane synthase [Kocuria sp.]
CPAPIGAHARVDGESLTLDVVVADPRGTETLRETRSAPVRDEHAAKALGTETAEVLLERGAAEFTELTIE